MGPQAPGGADRVDAGIAPPRGFITRSVHLAVVATAQRDDEFVAYLAPERTILGEAQMMGIRRPASANQTGLLGYKSDVLLVAKAARLGMGQSALIDAVDYGCFDGLYGCRSSDEEGWSGDITGDDCTSATSAALSSVAILARNASSTCRASAAVRLFLAPRIRCAQLAASSAEAISANSTSNCRHRAADASASRIGLADGEIAEVRPRYGRCGMEYRRPPFSRSLPWALAALVLRSGLWAP